MENIDNNTLSLINNIKKDIICTRNRALALVNNELINLYFRIGKVISENSRYGNDFINNLSSTIKIEFPDMKGFSPRNLNRMRKFYEEYMGFSILPTPLANLPWSFNNLLIDRVVLLEERIWYAERCIENTWTYIVLEYQISTGLYGRQHDSSKKLTNFKDKLDTPQGELALEMIKDPYIFEVIDLEKRKAEKNIEKALLENIKSLILEFGIGFSFVGNQYKVSTPLADYYIDLLFYNVKLKCYVVIELKNTDFKPEYIGQLQFYVTAVDETIKNIDDNPTIGLLLCKNKEKTAVQWSLKASNVPVGVASMEINDYLPTQAEINEILNNN